MKDLWRLCGALLVALAACPAPPPPVVQPPPPPPPPPAAPDPEVVAAAECHEQAVSFKEWLQQVEATGWPLASSLLDGGAHLVEHGGPALDEPAPVIHLTAREVALDGVRAVDLSGLGSQLAELLELRRRTMELSPFIAHPRVYLAIDADVPWERVTESVARASASGFERVTFVFADPARALAAPPPSTIDRDIAKLENASPAKRQQILAELLAYVYQSCPSALALIAQFGHEVAEMQQALVEQLPNALEGCRCAPENASARALHWALYGNPHPGSGFTVTVAQTPARVIKAAPAASWQDAHGQVLALGDAAAGDTVGFALEEPPPPVDDEAKPKHGKPKGKPKPAKKP